MPDPDLIEFAGNCPKCSRPCEGYRIIPPKSLVAVICRNCQTVTLLTQGYDICVASLDWWAKVSGILAAMSLPVNK